jgi:hypothetical protein
MDQRFSHFILAQCIAYAIIVIFIITEKKQKTT